MYDDRFSTNNYIIINYSNSSHNESIRAKHVDCFTGNLSRYHHSSVTWFKSKTNELHSNWVKLCAICVDSWNWNWFESDVARYCRWAIDHPRRHYIIEIPQNSIRVKQIIISLLNSLKIVGINPTCLFNSTP